MRDSIQFRWFIKSLSESQKKDFSEMSINNQKDWYISWLEEHFDAAKHGRERNG